MENQENEQAFSSSGDDRKLDDASMAMDGPLRSGEQQQAADNLDETDPGASDSAGGYGNDFDPIADNEESRDNEASQGSDESLDTEDTGDEQFDEGPDDEEAEDDEQAFDEDGFEDDDELPDGNGLTPRRDAE